MPIAKHIKPYIICIKQTNGTKSLKKSTYDTKFSGCVDACEYILFECFVIIFFFQIDYFFRIWLPSSTGVAVYVAIKPGAEPSLLDLNSTLIPFLEETIFLSQSSAPPQRALSFSDQLVTPSRTITKSGQFGHFMEDTSKENFLMVKYNQ